MFVSEHVGVWRWADDPRGVWILVSLELIWLATGQFQTSLIQEVAWVGTLGYAAAGPDSSANEGLGMVERLGRRKTWRLPQ